MWFGVKTKVSEQNKCALSIENQMNENPWSAATHCHSCLFSYPSPAQHREKIQRAKARWSVGWDEDNLIDDGKTKTQPNQRTLFNTSQGQINA